MSLTFDRISELSNGARFVRADLHIHSSASVDDVSAASGMTPERIIDSCAAAGLQIISITDHNTIDAQPSAIEYAKKYAEKLLFIAGIEVSAIEGHVLVYFDPQQYENLERFFAVLDVVRDEQGSRVRSSMVQVIRAAADLGGICVAAHIDTAIGFESGNPGFPAWKKDLLLEPGLCGLEFRDASHSLWYSSDEPLGNPEADERRKYARAREDARLGPLARLHNSDAHTMADLTPPKALNRIKVTALTFDAFRSAFADPEARVKINELVPPSIPRVIGLGINGGFLDETAIRFSDNLNVFLGGRGTGKSTAVKAIAFGLGRENYDAGNSPFQSVSLFCEDAEGVAYRFDRMAGADVVGRIRQSGSVTAVSPDEFIIEYYGQGELGQVAQRSLTDPVALQDFLDRHIDFKGLRDEEEACIVDISDVVNQLAPLMEIQKTRGELERQLQGLEERLKASENSKIKQVAEFQNRLTGEKTLRTSVADIVAQYRRGISLKNLIREPAQLKALSRVSNYAQTTMTAFTSIEQHIDKINDLLVAKTRETNAYLIEASADLDKLITIIDEQHAISEVKIQRYVDDLRDKGLASSIGELNELSRRKGALIAQIAKIDGQTAAYEDLCKRFDEQLALLRGVRNEIKRLRVRQRQELNRGFNSDKSSRFEVLLVPHDNFSAPEFTSFITEELEGSYYQAEAISKLPSSIEPAHLADLLDSGDLDKIAAVEGIGPKWAPIFLERLARSEAILRLRTLERKRAPRFKVLDKMNGTETPFAHLSDGQKHTILLTVALLAGARYPLIIDQPEDDLDNKFIADRVVKTLREVKEERQVILVTHNANIAVLGDSEQLIAMEHNDANGGGRIASRGSIDDEATRLAVQNTLEGGAEALRRRWKVYGLK